MEQKITKDTNIIEAITMNPNALDILLDAGFGCIGCSLATEETLGQGLAGHGMPPEQIDKLIEELNVELE